MTRVRAMKTRRRRSRPRRPRPRDVAAGRATRLALSLRYARARRSWLPRSLAARLSSAGRSTTNHVRTTRKTPLHFSPMCRESPGNHQQNSRLSLLSSDNTIIARRAAGGCSHHRTQQLNCFISGPDTHVRIALYHSTRLMTTRPPRLPPRLSISQLLVLLHTRSRSICTYAPDPPCTFP